MEPLAIAAVLRGGVALPDAPLMLDALLGAAICVRDGLLPASMKADLVPLDIPLARSDCGRLYLCSASDGVVESNEARTVNRKFPLAEAQALAVPSFKRITVAGGPCKSYRLPLTLRHFEGDRLRWWAVGDEQRVRALLDLIGYLGKRRAVGYGRVDRWEVSRCTPWGAGFPVVHDGLPQRPLPEDWPGLAGDYARAYSNIEPPYWRPGTRLLCAMPRWS